MLLVQEEFPQAIANGDPVDLACLHALLGVICAVVLVLVAVLALQPDRKRRRKLGTAVESVDPEAVQKPKGRGSDRR